MKKVLSFCVLSVLLAVLSLGLKAQSGLVLNPANLSSVVLNQYDTVYLSPNSDCFDSLGLAGTDQVSIEWQVLYNGSVIPSDSLSFYFEEFKFESRYDLGMAERWWGRSYTSAYCQNGDGYGSYPGANTPTAGLELGQQCEDPGHFVVTLPGHNQPFQFDYFYVRWFRDVANTAHRLVYNIKVDGEYQFIFSIAQRCGGSKWDYVTEDNDERYYVGGHQSEVCGILSSDTLHTSEISSITDYYRCVGDSLVIGNPAVTFTVSTDTTIAPGYDSVFYMGPSSCNGAIDSIVRFRVFFEDPSVPTIDTAGSILLLCDSGQFSVKVNLTAADKCIWLDENLAVVDTLDATATFAVDTNVNSHFYALGFNSASGCVSSDTMVVYLEVYASPNPVVTATPDSLCENSALQITLDQEYDKWTWFHDGTNMNLDTIVYDVADVHTTDAGMYWATVSVNHTHSVYATVDTIACSATDSARVVVFERPSVAWATLDGVAVADSIMFCPNDLEHVLVATISGGTAPYDNINWTGTGGTRVETYSTDKDSDTLTITATATCGAAYTAGIDYAIDANGCILKDTVNVTFFVNDTLNPTVNKTKDTLSAPAYADCEYIIPDVMGIITTNDNCGLADTVQVPAAGSHVTTDTIVVVTVTDLCGNTATDTIQVRLPVDELVVDTIEVTATVLCAGDANGAIRITVDGGLAPYDVKITHHTVTDSVYTKHGAADQTVFDFDGLIAGKWDIEVTDTNKCQVVVNDTADVAAPDILTLSTSDWTDLTCYNDSTGSFKFNVKQGTAPYEVKILHTLAAVTDSVEMTLNSASLDTTVTMENLPAGIYVINVVDGHGCTATATDTIIQPDQLMLLGDTVLAHVLCFGDSIGNLAVTGVTGGTYPYSYAWLNASNDTVSRDSVTGAILPAGEYTIYVTDANGCQADRSLTDTIKQPNGPLTLAASDWTDLTCFESNDGSFKYNVKEGTAPYYVTIVRTLGTDVETINDTLDPAVLDTTVLMQNMKAGAYEISVVDDNGCMADTIRDTLTQPDQLVLVGDTILNHIKCFGDANGNLAVTGVTGGTTPYVYEWRYAANDSVVSTDSVTGRILTVGTYTIYITDANNCAPNDTLSATILGPDTALTVMSLVAPVNDTCPHLGNYMFNAEVKGGRTDYTFQWTFNTVEVRNYTTDALKDTFNYVETVISCDTTFNIVFTVTDDSACTASKDITFTIQDTMKPVLAGTIDTTYIDGCKASAAPDTLNTIAKMIAFGLTVSDNCTPTDSLTVNYTEVVTGTCPIEVVRTYSVTDKCGLTSDELKQVIYVQDTTAPVFTTLPTSDTIYCDGDETGMALLYNDFVSTKAGAAADDNCALDSIAMVLDSVVQGCNHIAKTYYYSFRAVDSCNNSVTEYATFTILDTTRPRFTYIADDVTMECAIDDIQTIRRQSLSEFRFIDDCADNAIILSDTLSDFVKLCGPTGYYKHYVVITDSCQTDTAFHLINIVDTKMPTVIQHQTNPIVDCDGMGNKTELFDFLYGSLEVADSCSGVESIVIYIGDNMTTVFDTSHSALLADSIHFQGWNWDTPGDTVCKGHYTFTWVVTDSCGNSNSTTESFTIIDRVAPVFTLTRTDTTVDCEYDPADFDAWLTLPKSFDECSQDSFPVTYTKKYFSDCGAQGIWRVTWRTEDECGNADSVSANWNIIDTVPPVVHTSNPGGVLTNDTLYYSSVPNWPAPDIYRWTKTNMDASESADFITHFIAGDTVYGNSNGATNVPHVFHTGITEILECGHVKDFYYENARELPDSSTECVKALTVDYVFRDACNRKFTITQMIYVLDTTPPLVHNIVDRKYFLSPDEGCELQAVDTFKTYGALNSYSPAVSTSGAEARDLHLPADNVEGYIVLDSIRGGALEDPAFTCDSTEIWYYTISDYCGNSTQFTHTIFYQDTMRPMFSLNGQPLSATAEVFDSIHQTSACNTYSEIIDGLNDSLTNEAFLLSHYGLEIKDCHSHVISGYTEVESYNDNYCPGKDFVRTYKVTKDCGRSSTYDSYFIVHLVVKDTIAPVATPAVVAAGKKLHDTTIYRNEVTACDFTLPNIGFTEYRQLTDWNGGTDVYDDCNIGETSPVTNVDTLIGGNGCDSTYTFRYVVADSCGNISTDTVTITVHVLDTLAPAISVATATLVDTQYYNDDCSLPVLNKWTTPQDALDHGVVFDDCNPVWGDAAKLVLLDSVYERQVCTINYTVFYKVKDACDNVSDTIFQQIVILDTVKPVVTPEYLDTLPTYMNDDAGTCWGPDVDYFHTVADVKAYDPHFNVVDCNVGDDSEVRLEREDSSSMLCTRIVLRTYVVLDSCGLVSNEFIQTIHVQDTSAPVITAALTPDTVYMDINCDYTHRTFATIGDLPTDMQNGIKDCNLKDELILVSADTIPTGSVECYKAYTVVVNYKAQDSCGHSTAFVDTIYVADTIAPLITGHLDTAKFYTDETTCQYTIDPAYDFATVSSLPAGITITDCKLRDDLEVSAVDTVNGFCPMLIHRKYTVKDSCGHESYFHQYFEVYDTFAPNVTNTNLTNDTVYIDHDGNYMSMVNSAYTTVTELNAHHGVNAGITDCNLIDPVSSSIEIETIDRTDCEGSYLTRKYTAIDSCDNVSDTVFHKIVLMDTIKPWMDDAMPDTVWAVFEDPCTFKVPNLEDTVKRHYQDNWSGIKTFAQEPAADVILVNPKDTIVVVTFTDSCDNVATDTIRIINWADVEAPTTGLDGTSLEAFFAGACTFEIPNLEDTIKNHYADNWNTFYSTGSYDAALFTQTPASPTTVGQGSSTDVTVIYGDKCGNKDTVTITITVPDSLYISSISMTEPNCYGESNGTIPVTVLGGTADYTYSYSGGTIVTNEMDTVFKNVAAGTYLVTVTDDHACFDTATIVVTEPTQVTMTPVVINPVNCLNADTTEVAIIMAGGVANYNMTATLLSSEYDVIENVFDVTDVVSASDTMKINPVADTLYVAFYGEDSHGCSVSDTSDMIIVYPIYEIDTAARVCYTTIVDSLGYNWVGHKHFALSVFADVPDSTYVLYDSLLTVHNCDSVCVLHLQVTNNPYLLSRNTPAVYANDISDAVEQVIMDTLTTRGGTMSWEFFVHKNCMNCDDNNQVTVQYDWYIKNGDTYELMPNNVTDYFFPQYRTYYDNTQMDWYPASNNIEASNVSSFEIPHAYGSALLSYKTFTYYNLCWLMPEYNESCLQTYYPSYNDIATYGNFYSGGRAHTIKVSNFAQAGDYKLVVTLRKHAGGTPLNQFTTFSGCMDYSKIGGEGSHYVQDYATAEVYINVPDGMTVPSITPAPIGGAVVYSSNNETEPQANVYPNPARDYVQVELTGFEGQTTVSISGIGGKTLENISVDFDDVKTTKIIKIETGDFAQGVYMITARNKETIITKRVVIIR